MSTSLRHDTSAHCNIPQSMISC